MRLHEDVDRNTTFADVEVRAASNDLLRFGYRVCGANKYDDSRIASVQAHRNFCDSDSAAGADCNPPGTEEKPVALNVADYECSRAGISPARTGEDFNLAASDRLLVWESHDSRQRMPKAVSD